MLEISDRAKNYKGSPIRRIMAMLEKSRTNKNIISFGGGAPSLAPPRELIEYVKKKLDEQPQKSTAYCSTPGLPYTRQLISENLKDEEKIDVPADDIIITTGGTEGLYVALQTLVNQGDEIITTDPSYLGYDEAIKLAGGKEINVPIYWQEEFQILEERFKEKVTNKTKLAIVISPDNPTGGMQKPENMKAVIDICEDKGIWLLTDDIYKDMVFEGKFVNSRKYGGYENTITCCSFSKSASLPGTRIGYSYGPTNVIKKMAEMKQATTLAAPTTSSLFIDGFLENNARIKKEYINNIVFPTYKKRRDYMADMLKKYTNLEFHVPQGAFYYFIDIKQEDELFCDRLLNEKNVVAIPGKFFGENGKNHIRLTFVSEPEERIEQGIKKLGELLP